MSFLVGDGGGLEAIDLLDLRGVYERKRTENLCEKLPLHAESRYVFPIRRMRSFAFETIWNHDKLRKKKNGKTTYGTRYALPSGHHSFQPPPHQEAPIRIATHPKALGTE